MTKDLYAHMLVTSDTNPRRDEGGGGDSGARAWLAALRRALSALRARAGMDDGFTLIEVLMAAVILVVGLIGLLGLLDASVKASALTRAREGATSLGRETLEDARTIPYAQIIPTSIESQLQAMNGLTNATPGSGWHIARRGFTYTVAVSECAIDDPKDGLAKTHEENNEENERKPFCKGQQAWKAGEAEDTAPEDLKRITVEVSWTFRGRTSTVKQVSTLTAAGQAIGLVARELHLVEPPYSYNKTPTAPVITEAARETLTFSVSFPEGTSKIIWSLEGAKQEELTPASNATSLTFSWTINKPPFEPPLVSDGTYQIAAQAVDATGVIGPPISISVRLVRGKPAAPSGIMGGFNTVYVEKGGKIESAKVAELQWKANAERNVIGYRVYRLGGIPGTETGLACPSPSSLATLSTATTCIDSNPVEGTYSVFALYRNASEEVKESAPGNISVALATSTAPNPPTELVLTKDNETGFVTLKWKEPASGVKPAFYRIYRGSTTYTSRYGETTSTTYTDTDATAEHKYWVTAVSSTMTESTFLGPVTG